MKFISCLFKLKYEYIQNVNFAEENSFMKVNYIVILKFIRRKIISLANFVDLSMLIKVI